MLNLNEFIDYYSINSNSTKKDSREEIERFIKMFKDATYEKGGVHINGFAESRVMDYPERKRVNPKTGEEITVPAKKMVKLKSLSKFKKMED